MGGPALESRGAGCRPASRTPGLCTRKSGKKENPNNKVTTTR